MTRDRSLDEFVPRDDGAGESDDEAARPDETAADGPVDAADEATTSGGPDEPVSTAAVDVDADGPGESAGAVQPATSTYAWSGEGGTCAACGGATDRRWQQDGRLVCPECKEW
jgi:hypothetical protein